MCEEDGGDRELIGGDQRIDAEERLEDGISLYPDSSGFEGLDAFEKKGGPDIALLDICMPGMLGTELARDLLRCS